MVVLANQFDQMNVVSGFCNKLSVPLLIGTFSMWSLQGGEAGASVLHNKQNAENPND
jgi:hypothetical protein